MFKKFDSIKLLKTLIIKLSALALCRTNLGYLLPYQLAMSLH